MRTEQSETCSSTLLICKYSSNTAKSSSHDTGILRLCLPWILLLGSYTARCNLGLVDLLYRGKHAAGLGEHRALPELGPGCILLGPGPGHTLLGLGACRTLLGLGLAPGGQ